MTNEIEHSGVVALGEKSKEIAKWPAPPNEIWAFGKYRKYAEMYCDAQEIKQEEFEIPVHRYVLARPAQKPVAWRISGKNMNGSPFLVFTDSVNVGGQVIKREPLYLAPQPLHTTNCCKCGRIIDTREKKDGGDDFGAQLSDGRWTCSIECDDAVVDPQPVAVKPLEWTQEEGFGIGPSYKAVGGNIGYRIYDNLSDSGKRYRVTTLGINSSAPPIAVVATLDAAKARAQSDYETRIRSAIASPQPVINPTHSQVAGTLGLLTETAPADHLTVSEDAVHRAARAIWRTWQDHQKSEASWEDAEAAYKEPNKFPQLHEAYALAIDEARAALMAGMSTPAPNVLAPVDAKERKE